MSDFVERFLLPNGMEAIPSRNEFGFLVGKYKYKEDQLYSLDDYAKVSDIIQNSFSFIVGNGGIGKSVFITQVEKYLQKEQIQYTRINLRDLTNQQTLFERINDNFHTDEIYFVLLDSVDEAIDIGINNISETIIEAIEKCYKLNQNIKTIITCRNNRFPKEELVGKMKKIYNIPQEDCDFIYNLCCLREIDIIQIAKNLGCNNSKNFIDVIKKLHIGNFAATPILLPVLVQMYNNKILSDKTNQFDIYEKLMEQLCDETEYRKNKAQNGFEKFIPPSKQEMLFVAAKIAIELKTHNKNYISHDYSQENAIYIEDLYKLGSFYLENTKIEIDKHLIDHVLRTKIFERTTDKYCFAQKTYQDFLVAYYFYNMKLSHKDYKKLFVINDIIIPNYVESVAYLASKDIKFFDDIVHNSIEELITSSVIFSTEYQRKKLFKEYMRFYETKSRFKFNILLYKLLNFDGIENELKKYLKSKNSRIVSESLNFIFYNEFDNFNEEIENLIFDKTTDFYVRCNAIKMANSHKKEKLIKKIFDEIDYFKNLLADDSKQNLRGILLSLFYPKYYKEQEILPWLVEIEDTHYFGHYNDFIKYRLIKSISNKNIKIFWNWFIKHQNITGITKGIYSEHNYPTFVKKLFEVMAENLDDLMDECIDFQLCQKYQYDFFSETISEKIDNNSKLKIAFIEKLINKVDKSYFEKYGYFYFSFNKEDTKNLLTLLLTKRNNTKHFTILKYIIDKLCYRIFINAEKYDDVEELYPIIMNNLILKKNFEYFFNGIPIDNKTLEPINQIDIDNKKAYYKDLAYQQKRDNRKSKEEKQKNFYNDTITRINELLEKYHTNSNTDVIFEIIKFLRYSKEHGYYNYTVNFDVNNLHHWNVITEQQRNEIVDIAIRKIYSITDIIEENNNHDLWLLHSFLYITKQKQSQEQYISILKSWINVVSDTNKVLNTNETNIRNLLLKDIIEYYPDELLDVIKNNFANMDSYFFNEFLETLEAINYKTILEGILNIIKSNINSKISNENSAFAIKYLFESNFKTSETKDLLMKKISNIKESLSDKNVRLFSQLVKVSLKYDGSDAWQQVKKIIYKSPYCKKILVNLYNGQLTIDNRVFYAYLSDKEVIELYKNISKKFPEVYDEYPINEIFTPIQIKELFSDILRNIKRRGNLKNINKIKKEYLKNCPKDRMKISYDCLTNEVKKNFAQNKNINIKLINKLEEKNYKEKTSKINIIFKPIKYLINGNHNTIIERNEN